MNAPQVFASTTPQIQEVIQQLDGFDASMRTPDKNKNSNRTFNQQMPTNPQSISNKKK